MEANVRVALSRSLFLFLWCAFLFLFVGCDFYEFVVLHNTSPRDVYVMQGFSFPDTAVPSLRPGELVRAGDSVRFAAIDWMANFSRIPSGVMMWFVFDADTVNGKEWSRIREEYNVLRRYDLRYGDLRANGMKILYP